MAVYLLWYARGVTGSLFCNVMSVQRKADLAGPTPYSGETAEKQEAWDMPPFPGMVPEDDSTTYKWVYANGEWHLSPVHDHEQLLSHTGADPDSDAPTAIGYVDVTNRHARWRVASNIGLRGLYDACASYSRHLGWHFDGLADISGKQIYGPVRSFWYRTAGDNVEISFKRGTISSERGTERGTIYRDTAFVSEIHPGLVDWAQDFGYKLAEVPDYSDLFGKGPPGKPTGWKPEAPDTTPAQPEPWQPGTWGKGHILSDGTLATWQTDGPGGEPHHSDMQVDLNEHSPIIIAPGGWYTDAGNEDMPHIEPARFAQAGRGLKYVRDPDKWQIRAFSSVKQAEVPGGGNMLDHMKHKEDIEMFNRGDTDWEPPRDNPDQEPEGPFKCKLCSEQLPDFPSYKLHMKEHEGMPDVIEDGHFPQPEDFDAPLPLRRTQPYPEMAWNGVQSHVIVLPHSKEAHKIPEFQLYSNLFGFEQPGNQYYGAYWNGELLGYGVVRPIDDPWIRKAEIMMIQAKEHGRGVGTAILSHIQKHYDDLYSHADSPAGEALMRRCGMVNVKGQLWKWAAGTDPKDMLEAAVPFIYDISNDKLELGYPGTSTHDVVGQFTPGGIVEGYYEPGGKVVIETATTMPYSVRHLMDLWKYTAPQMEITSVEMTEPDGSTTKLATTLPSDLVELIEQYRPKAEQLLPEVAGEQGGGCRTLAERFKRFAQRRQFPALLSGEVSNPRHPEYGVRMPGVFLTPDDHGYGDRPQDSAFKYHTATIIPHEGNHYLVDWAAQQFGYPDFPKVSVYGQGGWQRESSIRHADEGQHVGQYMQSLVQSDPVVANAYKALQAAGGRVYVVGGAVRDALLGQTPRDIDLMVSGLPPEEVEHALRQLPGQVNETGKRFGVFRYKMDPHSSDDVEIALPRTDVYESGRRGEGKITVDPNLPVDKDLERRDFTANSMAVDLDTGQLIDPYGGADDLQRNVLRTTHPNSFEEDPTRLIRALTAHSRFGLNPDERTRHEMEAHGHLLRHESPDALNKTLDKLFGSNNPAGAIRLGHETGVLPHVFPEVANNWDYDQRNPHHRLPLGQHLTSVLDNVSRLTDDPDVRMAALYHDVGKPASAWTDPETGTNHYYRNPATGEGADHEDVGAQLAEDRMRALNYPVARIARVRHLIQHHMFPPFNTPKGARRFIQRVGDENADDLLNLREADQTGKGQTPEEVAARTQAEQMRGLVDQARFQQAPTTRAGLAINGQDLINMGIKPGPGMGGILQALTDHVVDNPQDNNRETLMSLVPQFADF